MACQNLFAGQLCQQAVSQGVNFFSKRSLSLQLGRWKWQWLLDNLKMHEGGLEAHCFAQHRRKWSVVRKGVVQNYPVVINLQLICCKMEVQLNPVKMLFGSWCLIDFQEQPPRINDSKAVADNYICNVIIALPAVQQPFVQNTRISWSAFHV